jgi:hypothetical protein
MSLLIDLPKKPGAGIPLIDWLKTDRAGNPRSRRSLDRMIAFIQQWDHLRDEMLQQGRGEPVVRDYQQRWEASPAATYRMLDEFREIFGPEASPSELCDLLWNGMPKGPGPMKWLLAVEIVGRVWRPPRAA